MFLLYRHLSLSHHLSRGSGFISHSFSLFRFEYHIPENGIFKDISIVIDGTDLPIERPSSLSKLERQCYFSGRKKENARSKYNLKYTVAVQISSGIIVWIGGPDPGSLNDIRALRESEFAEIIDWDPLEIIIADKGYQGYPNTLTPFKNPSGEEEGFNTVLSSVRQIVECSLQRIKIFGILGDRGRFRNGAMDYSQEKHKKFFNICCQITNICLEREPLWQRINPYLL
jgi:hypothetical protein